MKKFNKLAAAIILVFSSCQNSVVEDFQEIIITMKKIEAAKSGFDQSALIEKFESQRERLVNSGFLQCTRFKLTGITCGNDKAKQLIKFMNSTAMASEDGFIFWEISYRTPETMTVWTVKRETDRFTKTILGQQGITKL